MLYHSFLSLVYMLPTPFPFFSFSFFLSFSLFFPLIYIQVAGGNLVQCKFKNAELDKFYIRVG